MTETNSVLRGGIIINEILVDPINNAGSNFDTDASGTADVTDEFVEVYNKSTTDIDIGGLELWDANARNWFTFPVGTVLKARSYAYVVAGTNGGTLATPNPDTLAFDAGRTTDVLTDASDNVVLYDPIQDEYVQLIYNDDTPDDPTTYTGFSASATLVGTVEDWKRDVDTVSIARDLSSSTKVFKQNLILDATQGQPTATPGISNGGGTSGDDTLVGTDRNNTLNGGGGNDIVSGGGGNDKLSGNLGEDELNGGAGDDELLGGLGNDTLNGDAGDDMLLGQSDADTLNGGIGNDTLDGGSGNDVLNGGGTQFGEVDTLFGRAGADTFVLGEGDTVFYRGDHAAGNRGGSDRAFIRDFSLADGDVIQVSGQATDYYIETYDNNSKSRLVLRKGEVKAADDILAIFTGDIVAQGADLSTGVGFSFVTAPDETFVGTNNVDWFFGKGGNDTISGLGGDDLLNGAGGDDVIFGGDGNDLLNGDGGNDRLVGQGGDDLLIGGGMAVGERDTLIGGGGADTFVLGSVGTVLYAGGQGGRGSQDRAAIQDFDLSEGDVIRLAGVGADYTIETYSMGSKSRLVWQKDGANEIISTFLNNIVAQGADLTTGAGFEFV